MTTTTARFGIIKPAGTDPVKSGDDHIRAAMDRIDYMLGESGDNTITPSAANTKTTKVIAFSRQYKTPPRVLVCLGRDAAVVNIGAGVVSLWVDDVTVDNFTVAINRTTTAVTDLTWTARPNATDVTP